jgi:hypothetical protein
MPKGNWRATQRGWHTVYLRNIKAGPAFPVSWTDRGATALRPFDIADDLAFPGDHVKAEDL